MKKSAALIILLMVSFVVLVSCGKVDDIDISEYKDSEIIFSGLTDKEKIMTVEELKELECVTVETESTSDKIGTVRATGPLLSTLVESYGHSLKDFSKIVIYATDDYDIKLDREFLSENDIILAFGIDGEPLAEDVRPVRIIIPESDSAYWIRMVSKIEFVK